MLYLSLFSLNLLYKSQDVYNSGRGVVPNSDVYKYSDPAKVRRRDEDLEGVPTETHHGRISKKTGKHKMEKEGMKGDG